MTREEEIILAERAQEILNNPAWVELMAKWRQDLAEAFAEHYRDDDVLRQIANLHAAQRELVRHIEDFVATGKMAVLQIETANRRK